MGENGDVANGGKTRRKRLVVTTTKSADSVEVVADVAEDVAEAFLKSEFKIADERLSGFLAMFIATNIVWPQGWTGISEVINRSAVASKAFGCLYAAKLMAETKEKVVE